MTDTIAVGDIRWHISEPDVGPDVGLDVQVDDQHVLYAGEMPDSPGWCLALYTESSRTLIAEDVHTDAARRLIDVLSVVLARPAPSHGEQDDG